MRTTIISWICLIGIFLLLLFAAAGCNSSKHVVSQSQSYDSTYEKSLQDSVHNLRTTNERLEQTINEMQYAGVVFDTVFVAGKNDTVVNTVTITKEGDIKATGNISSAYVSKSLLTKIVNEKQAVIDSLSTALSTEKKNVKVDTSSKDVQKQKKVSFPWLWIIVMFILGGFVWDRSKSFILKLLKL